MSEQQNFPDGRAPVAPFISALGRPRAFQEALDRAEGKAGAAPSAPDFDRDYEFDATKNIYVRRSQ